MISVIDSEQAVLACILMRPEIIEEIEEVLTPEDFIDKKNSKIYESLLFLHKQGKVPDLINASDLCPGETEYMAGLLEILPNTKNIFEYATTVKESSIKTKLLNFINEIKDKIKAPLSTVKEIVFDFDKILANIQVGNTDTIKSMNDLLSDGMDRLDYLYTNKDAALGIQTGYKSLDNIIKGFQLGELIIVAARPGMGKTSFVMNIAINVAKSNKTVAIFSLEMSNAQLFERIIGTECCIPVPRLRICDIKQQEWKLISKKCEELSPLGIYIDDAPDLSILDIKNRCKRIKKVHGLDLIIVDYLQLIKASRNLVREQQVTEISHGLKALAKELNVPVIATAQLNRQVENGENKRPHLSSIRESGSVEQDADMIIGLYRDELYNENSPDKGLAEVIIIKNRSGSLGNIKLGFEKEYVKFKNM